MEISYTTPLRRAWHRMKAMLFRPLHIERWFVLGFAVFLAGLPHPGGMFSWNSGFPGHHRGSGRGAHLIESLRQTITTALEKPVVLFAIACALVFAGIVVLVLAWLSARARLIYLDNVATGRAEFVEPWGRLGRLGRSLFLWYAAFSFTLLLPIAALAWPFGRLCVSVLTGLEPVVPAFGAMFAGGALAVLLACLIAFVGFMTCEFVEPIMLIHDESASAAWGRFWPLFTSHLGEFIAYALFVLVLGLGVTIALAVAGVATCCIGLVLMMIPYVSSVLLLPVEVTTRALGPEFLAQFGPEWDLFASKAPKVEAPADPQSPEPPPGGPLPG